MLCVIYPETGLGRSVGQEPSLADTVLKEVPIGLGMEVWEAGGEPQAFLWLRAGYLLCRCDGCEAVLLGIEQQVLRANQYKENHSRTQQQVEAEVRKRMSVTCSRVSMFAPSSCGSWCRCNSHQQIGSGLVGYR